jgi:hypothetical protein
MVSVVAALLLLFSALSVGQQPLWHVGYDPSRYPQVDTIAINAIPSQRTFVGMLVKVNEKVFMAVHDAHQATLQRIPMDMTTLPARTLGAPDNLLVTLASQEWPRTRIW